MSATTYPVSLDLDRPATMSRGHVFLRIVLLVLVLWIAGSGGGVGLVYLAVPVVAAILIARKGGDSTVKPAPVNQLRTAVPSCALPSRRSVAVGNST